jgi:hypothetical protein
LAASHVTTANNGMSAKTLECTLGVRYRVGWPMLQRLREAMVNVERKPLSGQVEVADAPCSRRFQRQLATAQPNRRTSRSRGLAFRRLLKQSVVTKLADEADVTPGYDWLSQCATFEEEQTDHP